MAVQWQMSADEFLALVSRTEPVAVAADPPRDTKKNDKTGNEPDPFAVLADLPLLHDDKKFIEEQIKFLSHTNQRNLLIWYRRIWIQAQERERNVTRKENTGRRRANSFLRRYITRIVRRTL